MAANLDRINTGLRCSSRYSQLLLLILLSWSFLSKVQASQCHSKCSPFFTLPWYVSKLNIYKKNCSFSSFGAFDRCIENTCKELCRKDGNRQVAACYCRGTVEGPTLRACFCSAKPGKKTGMHLF